MASHVPWSLPGSHSTFALPPERLASQCAAQSAYALSYRAVTELASLDPERGLSLFFDYWTKSPSLDVAVRRAFGVTLTGFEKEFQARTRRRYGGLALFAGPAGNSAREPINSAEIAHHVLAMFGVGDPPKSAPADRVAV